MSTSGTGISPAAPDQSDSRSTNCDASSSRLCCVVSDFSPVVTSADSAPPVAPDPGVSCVMLGPFLVSAYTPSIDQSLVTSTGGGLTTSRCRVPASQGLRAPTARLNYT